MDYEAAKRFCQAEKMEIVSIDSQEEQQAINQYLKYIGNLKFEIMLFWQRLFCCMLYKPLILFKINFILKP